ncbi:bifunctional [glutamate--ammonia ligase]-adenylyl-L-tyrosine phosphorylase/[glutamate--ammonia-ligase] adenylyltransferase [Pasteurella atlantica]|uniref:bifunctional [glutamate--ammonia ligase]-adenylyl-L-tyrosine phosphorylase/[glutamate--ammonia-ligase] adenylyltransferase n=1 Tax=Pasteurellaceae TaxID=712 RepID=UPI002776064B|nr:bifunctional [glutamate--ammonia ligase]-adenylyl-L-tyrosine phosphorylase/[glutamate--ammonia-ligase] adenylyltransferase [Pasteurella atlantica]MDP8034324.1 bifunctional [glutamate--ammonia ligase]-adenylyl-L-tyrosine phosphorylase/[glutamate--ammonia-ligase] adenylyltransferase [Pasteurella atlantica]MDP8036290.1 bifunctional [glutamate--ammonia ligase]-adenylyl-L-tyrosine phosphorylase/[glutamate--ammonia-ligase] adenylyltransferase [Pasteurella atlantica]MDP8038207.1 bifunctional [glutam
MFIKLNNQFKQQLNQLFQQHSIPENLQNSEKITPLITSIAMSDFVFKQLQKQPDLLQHWLQHLPILKVQNDYHSELTQRLTTITDKALFHKELRLFRNQEMANLIFLQSNKLASVEQVFIALSELAECLILNARNWLFTRLCEEIGTPKNSLGETQELIILGMGKLGGGELNFSSDIDLIFCYPDQGQTEGGRKSLTNYQFFTRLGQRLIQALDQITIDGFVYRTDMRLRPFGESGALVFSFDALEDYYQEQGRDWERYAMIKAKILGEDPKNPDHRYLAQLLRPFVYRRYLDFSAIQSLREMKQKISREVIRRNLTDNIKLGAGGIREIEFIVQTFQMIRGGRNKTLRSRSLLQNLCEFEQQQVLNQEQITQLYHAYIFFRQIENVLQAIDDKQTQTLPSNETDRLRLILACQHFIQGKQQVDYPIADWQSFMIVLNQHQANVRAIFNQIIGEESQEMEQEDEPHLVFWKDILHYPIPEKELDSLVHHYSVKADDIPEILQYLNNTLQEWRKKPIGVRGRNVLNKLMPRVMDDIFQQSEYLILLPRLLNIIDKITLRTTYLELLLENKHILPRLILLCGKSVMVAEQIARHPILLDEFILKEKIGCLNTKLAYQQALSEYLLRIPEDDEEQIIDALRQFKQTQILNIATADILGELPVMKISDQLTYLAETIVYSVVNIAWKLLTKRFGYPNHLTENQCDFTVIAYGKLGGIELGYNSDLDLVFLHQAPINGITVNGKRSISSQQFYLKLAQKINSIFSLNTTSGILYEIDMRLRPSGESGLLVSSFEAYDNYQHNEAWTWENQALVRSRCVYGTEKNNQKFEKIRQNVLKKARVSGHLKQEICNMRAKMYQHLASHSTEQFHLKQDQGGITDIEFIAQYLVLNYANQYPKMAVWSDNVRIFDTAMECDILTTEQGERLKECYTTLRNQIHHLNLQGKNSLVNENQFRLEREFVIGIWNKLFKA